MGTTQNYRRDQIVLIASITTDTGLGGGLSVMAGSFSLIPLALAVLHLSTVTAHSVGLFHCQALVLEVLFL